MNTVTIEKSDTQAVLAAVISNKNFILDKEQYLQVVAYWKSKDMHTAAQHIGYNLLRGFPPDRGFTRLSDAKVSSRANDPWYGYNCALGHLNVTLHTAKVSKYVDQDRADRTNATNMERFKQMFGIDLTAELCAAFPMLESKRG